MPGENASEGAPAHNQPLVCTDIQGKANPTAMEFQIYISYQQGKRHENVPIVKNVADHLSKEGYSVFFDLNEKERINNDANLSILQNAKVVLVFLDNNIEEMEPGNGFYKELQIVGRRVRDGFDGVRIYRYNQYERSQLQELIKRITDAEMLEVLGWLDRTMYGYDKERVDDSLQNVTKMVDSLMGTPNYERWKSWEKRRRILYAVIAILMLMLIGLIIYGERKKPMLLFFGGQTTKNYIESRADNLITQYPNAEFVHHSSSIACWMLLEDIMSDNKSRTHYPVVLSSMKIANIQDMLNEIGIDSAKFVKYRKIIEYDVGKVPMIVQLWPREEFKEQEGKSSISIEELKQLLTRKDINVYCTTSLSGTTKKYRDLLGKDSWPDNCEVIGMNTFAASNKSVLLVNEEFNYSKEAKNTLHLKLVDDKGEQCKIEAYVYSIALALNQENQYSIPKPVYAFLKKLGKRTGKPLVTKRNIATGGKNIICPLK